MRTAVKYGACYTTPAAGRGRGEGLRPCKIATVQVVEQRSHATSPETKRWQVGQESNLQPAVLEIAAACSDTSQYIHGCPSIRPFWVLRVPFSSVQVHGSAAKFAAAARLPCEDFVTCRGYFLYPHRHFPQMT
jgi:hypothetical protein